MPVNVIEFLEVVKVLPIIIPMGVCFLAARLISRCSDSSMNACYTILFVGPESIVWIGSHSISHWRLRARGIRTTWLPSVLNRQFPDFPTRLFWRHSWGAVIPGYRLWPLTVDRHKAPVLYVSDAGKLDRRHHLLPHARARVLIPSRHPAKIYYFLNWSAKSPHVTTDSRSERELLSRNKAPCDAGNNFFHTAHDNRCGFFHLWACLQHISHSVKITLWRLLLFQFLIIMFNLFIGPFCFFR